MNSLPGTTVASWPWWKKAITIGGTLLLLCVLWWMYIAHTIYDKLTVWLTLVIPVDPIITNLISDLLASVFYFALLPGFISRILFGISKQALWGTFVLVLVSVTVVDLTLGRDVFFGKNGQPRRFFVIRPDEGLVVTGDQTPDPTTGETPRPISREIVPSIRAMYHGRAPGALKPTEIDEKRLFDPSTGRALIWYHKDASGALKLYDGPGFDPESQEPLRPMTKELVPSVKGYIQNEKATFAERKRVEEKAALAERNRLAAQEAEERQRASEEQQRRLAEQAALQEKQSLDAHNKADLELAWQQHQSGNLLAASQYVNAVLARNPSNTLANQYNTSWRLGNVCNSCGTIVRVWDETIASDGAAANTAIGGVVGYASGRQIGNGRGRDAASVIGGIAGALIGNSVSRKTVRHVDIQMDAGNAASYLFGIDSNFSSGQRVRVTANGQQVSIALLQ